jgi:hypothetical protein
VRSELAQTAEDTVDVYRALPLEERVVDCRGSGGGGTEVLYTCYPAVEYTGITCRLLRHAVGVQLYDVSQANGHEKRDATHHPVHMSDGRGSTRQRPNGLTGEDRCCAPVSSMRSFVEGDLGFVHRLEQYCHIAALMAICVPVARRSFVSDAANVGLEHAVKLGE